MKSIQEIRDSLTKISKWPWESFKVGPMATVLTGNIPVCDIHYGINKTKDEIHSNGEFIAESPQIISDLCDRLEEHEKFNCDMIVENAGLKNKIDILQDRLEVAQEALHKYADMEPISLDGKPFLVDKGKMAREALEKIS